MKEKINKLEIEIIKDLFISYNKIYKIEKDVNDFFEFINKKSNEPLDIKKFFTKLTGIDFEEFRVIGNLSNINIPEISKNVDQSLIEDIFINYNKIYKKYIDINEVLDLIKIQEQSPINIKELFEEFTSVSYNELKNLCQLSNNFIPYMLEDVIDQINRELYFNEIELNIKNYSESENTYDLKLNHKINLSNDKLRLNPEHNQLLINYVNDNNYSFDFHFNIKHLDTEIELEKKILINAEGNLYFLLDDEDLQNDIIKNFIAEQIELIYNEDLEF